MSDGELDRLASLGYLTNWAARLLARALDEKLKPLGLSSGQLPVFFALADGRSMTQKQLVEASAVEQPTMAATLGRMERDGLIERVPHPDDRRSTLICLAPAARAKLPALAAAVRSVNGKAAAELGAAGDQALRDMLRKVIAAVGSESGPG